MKSQTDAKQLFNDKRQNAMQSEVHFLVQAEVNLGQ